MASRRFQFLLKLLLVLAAIVRLPVVHVQAADSAPPAPALSSLPSFARLVRNGQAGDLRGVYAGDLFAAAVVQQPSGDAGYISSRQDVLTEFSAASRLGSTGLLAHNYLGGRQFSQLQIGQVIYLVYGDGYTAAYVITESLRFRALQPNSAYSAFVDLETGRQTGAGALFSGIYGRPGAVILQTCIEAGGISTWGRLFVVAEPYPQRERVSPAEHRLISA